MVPPFGLDMESYMNMDFGLDDGSDPEDSSIVRPSDIDLYEHGTASPYQDKAMMLSQAQAKAEDNAMGYLMQALNKQADISPEQGIATALLAAIPTFGGYMIGKSVGSPDLPDGYFEAGGTRSAIGLDKMGDPGSEGGLAGAAAGAKSAQGYIGALEADQTQKNDVYQKMAAVESQKASRLESQANAYELAGMNQEQYNRRQSEAIAARGQGSSGSPTQFDLMSPAQKDAYLADKSGVDVQGNPIEKDPLKRDRVLVPAPRAIEKAAAADSLPVLQERVKALYNKAAQQIGPGFLEAYARSGIAAFPANIQNEFKSTLNSMAMEMNKAVDPTPSDAGRNAQLALLEGSVSSGTFLDLLDYKVKSARKASLLDLQPYTLGENANAQAKLIYDNYKNKWAADLEGFNTGEPSSPSNSGMMSSPGGTQPTQPAQGKGMTIGSRPQRSQFGSLQEYVNAMTAYNNSLKGSR